jgi:hypothetical protein
MEVNNGIKLNGIAVRNVSGGNYVSDDNPLPVKVIGGGISEGGGSSGGSDISLPTDANGNVLMNLNAIGTSQSLGVNIESVGSGVTFPVSGDVGITGTPSVIIKSSDATLPVSIGGDVSVKASSALPISGSVGITGTPTVNVGNTTAIKTSISNTPNVNLASVGIN